MSVSCSDCSHSSSSFRVAALGSLVVFYANKWPPPAHTVQVEALLESIPGMFANTQVMETCAGAALRSAVEALKGGAGGKVGC